MDLWNLIFTVLFEGLFFLNAAAFLLGFRDLRRHGAQVVVGPFSPAVTACLCASVLLEAAFFAVLLKSYVYIPAMLAGLLMVFSYVYATERMFSRAQGAVWFGFKRYAAGSVSVKLVQARPGGMLSVLLLPDAGGREFVFRVKGGIWGEIEKSL